MLHFHGEAALVGWARVASEVHVLVPEFEGSPLNLAGLTKKLGDKPFITVGSVSLDTDMFATFRSQGAAITNIDKLIEIIARDEVDLVAVELALLVDRAWLSTVRDKRIQELLPFTPASLRFPS